MRTKSKNTDRKKTGPKPLIEHRGFYKTLYRLALLGLSEKQIAEFFEVSKSTIENLSTKHDRVRETLKRGRKYADSKVAEAFYQRALGYSHPDTVVLTRTVKEYDEKGKIKASRTEPMIVPTMKHYPPDTFACFKWLSLRQRENWADSLKIDHNISADFNINYLIEMVKDPGFITNEDLQLTLQKSIQKKLTVTDAETNN
jgi:hypothetical protein